MPFLDTRTIGPGCVAIVPPDTPHFVKVLKAGRVLVTDWPRREAIGDVTL